MKSILTKGDNFIVLLATVPQLTEWNNFYVIIGAAAASLTGLMFVVVTLIVSVRNRNAEAPTAAFATPTVIHFGAALLVAAILSAPWSTLWVVSLLLGLTGLSGILYIIITARRISHQRDYKPVMEDWVWHTICPFVSYTVLFIASILLLTNPTFALYFIGAVTILLLFTGIHNSWDAITYITANPSQERGS